MNQSRAEVKVEDWSLGLIAGEWLYPDGDGYVPEPGSGERSDYLEAGDVWVEGPKGLSATIDWANGDAWSFSRMLPPRKPLDLGAFNVTTDAPPITRRDTETFLGQLLPLLRRLADDHDQ